MPGGSRTHTRWRGGLAPRAVGKVFVAFHGRVGYVEGTFQVGPLPEPAVVAGFKVPYVARAPRPPQ